MFQITPKYAASGQLGLIATTEKLDTCQSPACDNDPVPAHDRVAGNIPLSSLMEIIAIGASHHAGPVVARLEAQK